MKTLEFQFETLSTFLLNGTPIHRIDSLRKFLEKTSGFSLTSSSHLSEHLPALLGQEIMTILDEIKGQRVMVIFDGTSRVDEVFATRFRWVTKEMNIYERVVEIGKYKHTFNHEELITAVVKILTKFKVDLREAHRGIVIRNGDVIGFQRDRCATNACAVTVLTKNSIESKDMECLSHILTHVENMLKCHCY